MKFVCMSLFVWLLLPQTVFGQSADYLPGELYVKYAVTADAGAARQSVSGDDAIRELGGYDIRPAFPRADRLMAGKTAGPSPLSRIRRVRFPETGDMELLARKLEADPSIEYAEPIYINHVCVEPNDPAYNNLPGAGQQLYLPFINAPGAWEVSQGDSSVVVAIVDTGTDWQHPDLASQVWTNPGEIPGNGIDDDDNGYDDDVHGVDLYGNGTAEDGDPIPTAQSHGTHVTGIAAAATDNGIGVASLGWNLRFMPVKTGPDNSDEIIYGYDGILYAAENGADIINCSWGSIHYSHVAEEIVDSVREMGILIVAAAGNDSTALPFYPAAYSSVISVGSVNLSGKRSIFSNYGPHIDVYAPGNDIYSTVLDNEYDYYSGTSMAAPVVSSLAGLIMAAHPDWDIDQVKAQILGTVTPLPPDEQVLCVCGYIDAARALGVPPLYMEVAEFTFFDSVEGDGDGLFRSGEIIRAVYTVTNLGEAAGPVQLTASSLTGYLEPLTDTVNLGTFVHREQRVTEELVFRVAADVPSDASEWIRLDFSTQDGGIGISVIEVQLNPSYATLSAATFDLSFGNRGQIGYMDYPSNERGTGFVITADNSGEWELFDSPLMFEGGFLFATSADHVSDTVRGEDQFAADTDFSPTGTTALDDGDGVQTVTASFAESNDTASPVEVAFTGYAWDEPGLDQSVLLTYTLTNTGDQDITEARAGLFFDFDLPYYQAWDDQAFYVASDDIIVFDGDLTEPVDKPLIGVAALPFTESPWLIQNSQGETEFGIYDGFTEEEKWRALSGGKSGPVSIVDHDVSMVAGAPQFSLPSGDSHEVGFIIAYGIGYQELREQIQSARSRAEDVITAVAGEAGDGPETFVLNGVYPNPFNQSAAISFTVPGRSETELAVYAVTGQRIRTLHQGALDAGAHIVRWDGCDDYGVPVGSGVYLVRLTAGRQTVVTRMTLLK